MIHVFLKSIKEINPKVYEDFFQKMPIHMQEDVTRYKLEEDRQRTLLGKILLFDYLKENTQFSLSSVEKTKYNKPYISNSKLNFNISHSGEYVVLAISTSNVIGVDIEEIDSFVDINDFTEVLLEEELTLIKNSKDPSKTFYTIWTQKEAILKAEGKGFFNDVKEISIKKIKFFLWIENILVDLFIIIIMYFLLFMSMTQILKCILVQK